jgi:hypothetical protein
MLFTAASLAVGIAAGVLSTWIHFQSQPLPSKVFLQVMAQRQQEAQTGVKGPRVVVVNGETYDFGTMDNGVHGEHEFVIRNEGDAPLRLKKGQTSCKCTSSLLDGDDLPPGREAKIHLSWNVASMEESFSQSAEFETNDPQRRILRLAIVGRISRSLEPDAEFLSFPNVPASEGKTASLRIFTDRSDQLKIDSYRWQKPEEAGHFEVTTQPVQPEALKAAANRKSGVQVAVTVKPGMPLGKFANALVLTTNLSNVPPMEISIEGNIVGDISLLPQGNVDEVRNIVRLGVLPRGLGTKQVVRILVKGAHRDSTTLQVASVEPSHLKATLGKPLAENPRVKIFPLTLEVPAESPPVAFTDAISGDSAKVVITTTHPTIPRIVVYVQYVVKQ